jgi:phage terminase large subunit GpA-like protein
MTDVPLTFWTPHDDKIKITYETTPRWNGAPRRAYRWSCPCCGTSGAHQFDRFTDRIRKGSPLHPWRRCMAAVELHLWVHHRRDRRV